MESLAAPPMCCVSQRPRVTGDRSPPNPAHLTETSTSFIQTEQASSEMLSSTPQVRSQLSNGMLVSVTVNNAEDFSTPSSGSLFSPTSMISLSDSELSITDAFESLGGFHLPEPATPLQSHLNYGSVEIHPVPSTTPEPAQPRPDVAMAVATHPVFSIFASVHPEIGAYLLQQRRFRILSALGSSIYGHVFLAVDELRRPNQAPVALKISRVESIQAVYQEQKINHERDVIENPLFEAQIMQRVLWSVDPHHNSTTDDSGDGSHAILDLIDSFLSPDGRLHGLVTEYAPGGDLFEVLMRQDTKRMPACEARSFFVRIARGVNLIHQRGVCHLDLSLENVLLDSERNPKISDFGVARLLPDEPDRNKFAGLFVRSKPSYMAPEVLARQPFEGRKADVFSLGVILYCMLFGAHPFRRAVWNDASYALIATGQLREYLKLCGSSVSVSDSMVDLFSRTLCPESRRLSMDQLLKHAFLSESE